MKICQPDTKVKDVILPFFCPFVLCGNNTPKVCETSKEIFHNYAIACNCGIESAYFMQDFIGRFLYIFEFLKEYHTFIC